MARREQVPHFGPDPKLDPTTFEGRVNGPAAMLKVTGWRARAMFWLFLVCVGALLLAFIL